MAVSGALVGGLALALGMSLGANAIVLFDLGDSDGVSDDAAPKDAESPGADSVPRGLDGRAAGR